MNSKFLLIGTILILILLTAGCLDDLSSTLPPCCDGTCGGVKTSVIAVKWFTVPFESQSANYVVDSDGIYYDWYNANIWTYDPYNNHNVTFHYEMVNGHRHITGIIEDHDAKPKCECCQCEVQNPVLRYHSKACECVQKCCGCEGK